MNNDTRKAGNRKADERNWRCQPMATRRPVPNRRVTDVHFTPIKVVVYLAILAAIVYVTVAHGMELFATVWGWTP